MELTGDCPKGSYRGIIGVLQYPGGVPWGCNMYSGSYGAVELTGDCPKGSYRGIIGVLQYPGGVPWGCNMYSGAYGTVELTGDCPKGSYRGIMGVLQYPGGGSLGDVICIVEHMALLNSPVIAQRGPIGVL